MGNVAVARAAATVTVDGTTRAVALLVAVKVIPPVGAAVLKVTVHWPEADGPMLAGVQTTEETRTAALRLMVTLAILVPNDAASDSVWLFKKLPVVAVNDADVAPAGTVTEPGTWRFMPVLDKATVAPLAAAAFVSPTVQVVDPFAPTLVGLQVSEETRIGAIRLTVVVPVAAPAVAVSVAL
jgi:hypothetical protein